MCIGLIIAARLAVVDGWRLAGGNCGQCFVCGYCGAAGGVNERRERGLVGSLQALGWLFWRRGRVRAGGRGIKEPWKG